MSKWFKVWLLGLGIAASSALRVVLPDGIESASLGFANQRWAFYFLLACASSRQKSAFYLSIAFAIELAIGIGGYFSDFKTLFLVTMLAFAMSGAALLPKVGVFVGLLGAVLLLFGVIWTSVKNDYRAYVRSDSLDQVVLVGYIDRMGRLFELAGSMDGRSSPPAWIR